MGTTINVDINQSSANTSRENKQRIELIHPNVNVLMGDFETQFAHLDLLNYQDLIEGTQIKLRDNTHTADFLYSNPKGSSKKEIVYGNNSQGPYPLSFTPIVAQSEKVTVKGIPKEKDKDYQIDYISGKITFLHSILTPEDDMIVVYDSENSLFKDQVLGGSYGYSGFPSSNVELYYLQKRSAKGSVYDQKEITVTHVHHERDSFIFDSELGISEYTPNTLEAGNKVAGKALSIKAKLTPKPWEINGYYTGLGNTFQTVQATMAPGDYSYGANTLYKESSSSFLTSYSDHNQTIGTLIQDDKTLIIGGETQAFYSTLSSSGRIQNHREESVSGNGLIKYQRKTVELTVDTPLPLGLLKTNAGIEDKKFDTPSGNAYTFTQAQSAYTRSLSKPRINPRLI